MEISSIGSSGGQVSSTAGFGSAGKDEFLQLLVAQLRNQDPLNPMSDTEFVTQLAQFNSLEQLQSMNEAMQEMAAQSAFAQASSMIGMEVDAMTPDGIVTGVVEALAFREGIAALKVGDLFIAIPWIVEVREAPAAAA